MIADAIGSPSSQILSASADLRSALLRHPIYDRISDARACRIFMQQHVFAVLDFMWLLKRLQRDLCCVEITWLPSQYPELARFVNEIVLGEESDENGEGGYCSHFELYLQAMNEIEADGTLIREFASCLRKGMTVSEAFGTVPCPRGVSEFVSLTHETAVRGSVAQVASVFSFSREDVIPDMFMRLLQSFDSARIVYPRFSYYVRRHIELDGDQHGPLARRLVDLLCTDSLETDRCVEAVRAALTGRLRLWDSILDSLDDV